MIRENKNLIIHSSPHPFSNKRVDYQVPEGISLDEMLKISGLHFPPHLKVHVFVDDRYIVPANWKNVFPTANQILSVNVVPAGGGDGDSNKVFRTVALIAVVAIAVYAPYAVAPYIEALGPQTIGGAFLSAGVGIAGSLLVNHFIPPVYPDQDQQSGNERYQISGIRNQATPYEPVQRLFGRHRIYPKLAAMPYTEFIDDDQYLRMLFCIGLSDYELTEYKIGETLLSSFEGTSKVVGFKDDITEIFPYDVYSESTGIPVKLDAAGSYTEKTTQTGTEEIIVDISWPQGLWVRFDSGNLRATESRVSVEYATAGSSNWTHFSGSPLSVKLKSFEQFSRTFRETGLTAGQYDIRVKRIFPTLEETDLPGDGKDAGSWSPYLTSLKSISYSPPVNLDNCKLVALRIKATDQLNGYLDTFNCIATAKLPTFNATTSAFTATLTATRNPAWAYAEILRGNGNLRPVDDSDIDIEGLKDWADFCDAKGYHLDTIVEQKITIFKLLQNVAAVGRAARTLKDDKHSVIIDDTQTTAVQHFSPRNSRNFKGFKAFNDIPHALRCRFKTEDAGYEEDELVVYDDGYAAVAVGGTSAATIFETFDMWGITDPDHVWKMARYYIGAARLRPDVFQFDTGIEHIIGTVGDLVRLTHDIIEKGYGQAYITAVSKSGGNCIGITMDDPITMASGATTYGAQIRLSTGTMVSATIETNAGSQYSINFTPAVPEISCPGTGDMVFFGVSGSESLDCIISKIEALEEQSATLSVVEYAPAVLSADSGTIPAYTPSMTKPPLINRAPPVPEIKSISLAINDAVKNRFQVDQLQAIINFDCSIGATIKPDFFQLQYRRQDITLGGTAATSKWFVEPSIAGEKRFATVDVENNLTYDFRLRSVTEYGITSAWDTYSNFAVNFSITVPVDITGLALIQGGTHWTGGDCAIKWTQISDTWRVEKIKIEIYLTSPFTLLRTEYVNPDQFTYTYRYLDNLEDTAFLAGGGWDGYASRELTFKVYSVGDVTGTEDTLEVTNAAPDMSGVTPTVTSRYGFLEVSWAQQNDPDMDYYSLVYDDGVNPPNAIKIKHPTTSFDINGLDYGTTYYVQVTPYDIFGAGTPSQVQSGTTLEIPDVNIALELSESIIKTDYDSNSQATLDKLTDRNYISDGVEYTISTGTDKYIQYAYKIKSYFDRVAIWADDANGNVYLAYGDDGSTWSYLKYSAGEFVAATTRADAQVNLWSLSAGRNMALLPDNLTAKYIRLYIRGNYTTKFFEFIASRILISELAAIEHLSSISGNVGTLQAGVIQSANWGSAQGFYLDLDNERLRMGGSSSPKVDLNAATGSYTFAGIINIAALATEVTDRMPASTAISDGKIVLTGDGVSGTLSVGFTEADVTDYADTRVANAIREGTVTTITRLGGGSFKGVSGSVGAIKITLPVSWNNAMVRFAVDIFNYTTSPTSLSVYVGGYLYSSGTTWYKHFAQVIGYLGGNNRVRLGHDGSKCCVIIGDTADDPDGNTAWPYVSVIVKDLQVSFDGDDISTWEDGWSVSLITTTSGISFTGDYADALLDAGSQNLDWLIGSSGTLTIGSGGNLAIEAAAGLVISAAAGITIDTHGSLKVESGGGVLIEDGGSLTLDAGGDIIMSPDDSSPSKIIFKDEASTNDYDIEISRDTTNDKLSINPTSDTHGQIEIGGYSNRYEYSYMYAQKDIYIAAGMTMGSEQAAIEVTGGAVGDPTVWLHANNGTSRSLAFVGGTIGALYPAASLISLGKSGYGFDSLTLKRYDSAPTGWEGRIVYANWGTDGKKMVWYSGSNWVRMDTFTVYT